MSRLFFATALAWSAGCSSGLGPADKASPGSGTSASGTPVTGSPEAAVVGVLPFADDDPHRVWVNLAPEGYAPFVWRLDTGAQTSVLSPRAARARSVSVRPLKRTPYRRSTVLGRSLTFWVETRSSDTAARTFEYAVLGGQFLQHYVVEIDLPRRRVRFLDPDRYRVPEEPTDPGAYVLPLQVWGRRPFVDLQVGDRRATVLIDTGAPVTSLSGRTATALGIDWQDAPGLDLFSNVWGPMETRVVEARAVRLGGAELGNVPVAISPLGAHNMAGPADSWLGLDTLRPFVVRIDYARRRLWLKRVGTGPPTFLAVPYAPARRAGALLVASPGGGLVVAAVLPGTPADEMGLQPGDRPSPPPGGEVDASAFLRRVAEGREITVIRRQDDLAFDVVLPRPSGVE